MIFINTINALKEQLVNYTIGLRYSFKRFYIAFAHSIFMFAAYFFGNLFMTLSENNYTHVYSIINNYSAWYLLPGLLTAVFTVLLCEKLQKNIIAIKVFLPIFISVVILSYFQISSNLNNVYVLMAIIGYCGLIVCGSIFLLYTHNNHNTLFIHIIKVLIFSVTVSLIIMLGIFICITAVNELFLSNMYYNSSHVYTAVFNFCWQVLGIALLLSGIPKPDKELKSSGIIYTLSAVVALPIYLLLIIILNIYCFTILLTWQLPSGTVNWFASFALLFCVYFGLLLPQCTNKVIKLVIRILPFTLLPIVSVQIICIWVRVSAYGLTPARFLSLACILCGICAVLIFIFNINHKMVFICVGVICAVVTITPLNAINVPYWEQQLRFTSILNKYDLITENNQIRQIDNVDIIEQDMKTLESSFDYIKYSSANKSQFIVDATKNSFNTTFGITSDDDMYREYTVYMYSNYTKSGIDIDGYKQVYSSYSQSFNDTDSGIIDFTTSSGEHIYYDLNDEILQFYYKNIHTDDNELQVMDITLADGNKVIIDYVYYKAISDTQAKVNDFSWYLLVK